MRVVKCINKYVDVILDAIEDKRRKKQRIATLQVLKQIEEISTISPILKEFKRKWHMFGEVSLSYQHKSHVIHKECKKSGVKMTLESEFDIIGKSHWKISEDEYERVFNYTYINFFEKRYASMMEELQKNIDSSRYDLLLIKFNDTAETIYRTLNDSKDSNGHIDDEVLSACIELLKRFVIRVNEIKDNDNTVADLQDEAVRKNLIERLNIEKDYVDKFL